MPDVAPTPRAGVVFEPRLRCPACLGPAMRKIHLADVAALPGASLTLDHCERCGGVWFERGEVPRLARHTPEALRAHVGPRRDVAPPACHECRTPLARDAERCDACGRANVLPCPACREPMRRASHDGLALDVCPRCHGIWFDHAELEQVWKLSVDRAVVHWRARHGGAPATVADGAGVLLEALAWSPDLVFYGGRAVGHVAMGVGDAIASGAAAEAASAAVEIAGEAAGGVFEAIVEIIGGIFG